MITVYRHLYPGALEIGRFEEKNREKPRDLIENREKIGRIST